MKLTYPFQPRQSRTTALNVSKSPAIKPDQYGFLHSFARQTAAGRERLLVSLIGSNGKAGVAYVSCKGHGYAKSL